MAAIVLVLLAAACAAWGALLSSGATLPLIHEPMTALCLAVMFLVVAAALAAGVGRRWPMGGRWWANRGDAGAANPTELWGREPVMTLAVAQALVACLIGFGAPITLAQGGLIMAVVAAVVGWLARSQVTPAPPGP